MSQLQALTLWVLGAKGHLMARWYVIAADGVGACAALPDSVAASAAGQLAKVVPVDATGTTKIPPESPAVVLRRVELASGLAGESVCDHVVVSVDADIGGVRTALALSVNAVSGDASNPPQPETVASLLSHHLQAIGNVVARLILGCPNRKLPSAITAALADSDPHQRPSLTLICGIQCGIAKWNASAVRRFAMGNSIMGVDSYTEYKRHRFVSPDGSTSGSGGHIVDDIQRMRALLRPGQPLIVTLQAVFLLVYDCEHHKPHTPPNCAEYRYIEPDEARAEGMSIILTNNPLLFVQSFH